MNPARPWEEWVYINTTNVPQVQVQSWWSEDERKIKIKPWYAQALRPVSP